MIELTEAEIQGLCADIAGTVQTIREGIEELGYSMDDIGLHTLTEIDSNVFECEVCNWTCWRDEESNEEGVCTGCAEGEDDGSD